MFMYPLAGFFLDNNPGVEGYKLTFQFTAVMIFIGFIASVVLVRIVNKKHASNSNIVSETELAADSL